MANVIEEYLQSLSESKFNQEYYSLFNEMYKSAQKSIEQNSNEEDLSKEKGLTEYPEWRKKHLFLLREYSRFLKFCDLNPYKLRKHSPIELFKGPEDSLRTMDPYIDVSSIYAGSFENLKKAGGIQLTNVSVKKGVPCHVIKTAWKTVLYVPFDTEVRDLYYVHNPYNEEEEENILGLLENDDLNVIYGLYGYNLEGNIDEKVEKLRKTKEDLKDAKFFELHKENSHFGEYQIAMIYKPKKQKENMDN